MRTRSEIEQAAQALGDGERWDIWLKCGVHNWHALLLTDSGEHYWQDCCTLWTAQALQWAELERQELERDGCRLEQVDGVS